MSRRNKNHLMRFVARFVASIGAALLLLGCQPESANRDVPSQTKSHDSSVPKRGNGPEVRIPAAKGPLEFPERKDCVVLTIVHTPDSQRQVDIYCGNGMGDGSLITAASDEELKIEIGECVENLLVADRSKTAIMIEVDGRVKTGIVQLVKSGIQFSAASSGIPLFVSVLDVETDQEK